MTTSVGVAALVSVALTFGLWLAAMVTPGWFILSVANSKPPAIYTNDQSLFGNSLEDTNYQIPEKVSVSIRMSIFYVNVCNNNKCDHIPFDKLPSHSKRTMENLPSLTEIQIETVFAVSFCVISFFIVLLNFGSPSRLLCGGILMFIAAAVEAIVVMRMSVANVDVSVLLGSTQTLLTAENMSMEIETPYSIILAGIGLLASIVSMTTIGYLRSKSRQQATDGRVLHVYPNTNAFTILQETY
ncbi:uncharacterized protein LOC125650478 [Ostrea edulis]|uniref:uncharacterized protein LOC125650478 n=1 Tax=Ostrea edulis TaxID=37623 RepID=UPI0020949242|nr:uncharacterized protein LOC125650478 [Ostrea edulis]